MLAFTDQSTRSTDNLSLLDLESLRSPPRLPLRSRDLDLDLETRLLGGDLLPESRPSLRLGDLDLDPLFGDLERDLDLLYCAGGDLRFTVSSSVLILNGTTSSRSVLTLTAFSSSSELESEPELELSSLEESFFSFLMTFTTLDLTLCLAVSSSEDESLSLESDEELSCFLDFFFV